jgi:hypothetical protein
MSETAVMGGSVSRTISVGVVLASIFLGACSDSRGGGGPNPSAASQGRSDINNQLASVTCASASHCIAVGSSGHLSSDVGGRTLVEENLGSGWLIVPSPAVSTGLGSNGVLNDITCSNGTNCIAIGNLFTGDTVIEEKVGNTWTLLPR